MQTPDHLHSLLKQIARLGEEGAFGPGAQSSAEEYASLPSDIAYAAKYLTDFYLNTDKTNQTHDYLIQILIVTYKNTKKRVPKIATSFANAFTADFPRTTGTALLPRWISLAESCFGFKAVANLENRSMIWQHSSQLVLSMNEFLDGLIGLLIIAWRCAIGREINPNVLGNSYGSKVHEFSDLTDGEQGAFYLLFRLANPKLRNALAHKTIWPDYDSGLIRFIEGRQNKAEHEMEIAEFMALVKFGCDLARAYIAFLATILLLESGKDDVIFQARRHLVVLWQK